MTSPIRPWHPERLHEDVLEEWAAELLGVNLRDAYEVTIKPGAYVEVIWYEPRRMRPGEMDRTNVKKSKLIPIGDLLTAETIGTYTSDQLELIPSDE